MQMNDSKESFKGERERERERETKKIKGSKYERKKDLKKHETFEFGSRRIGRIKQGFVTMRSILCRPPMVKRSKNGMTVRKDEQ